jgi:hypothetical protein
MASRIAGAIACVSRAVRITRAPIRSRREARRIVRTKALSPLSVPRARPSVLGSPGQAPSPSGTRPVRKSVTRLAGDRPPAAKDAAPAGAPQSRSDRGVAAGGGDRSVREGYTMAAGAGGAGPGGCVECARPRWARMVRTTAESCTVSPLLAPHAAWRSLIVPRPSGDGDADPSAAVADEPTVGRRPTARPDWAALLKRVFAVDVLHCPRCGGPPANRRRAHAGRDPTRRPGRGQPTVTITAGAGRLTESAQLGRSSPRAALGARPRLPAPVAPPTISRARGQGCRQRAGF